MRTLTLTAVFVFLLDQVTKWFVVIYLNLIGTKNRASPQ